MKTPALKLIVGLFLILSAFAVTKVDAQVTTLLFTVNHNGDTNDANVGDNVCADSDGKCTLRAAIQEANFHPYQDAINFALPTPATIDLTLGQLPITSNIYIAGPGARKLSIQRSSAAGTPDFRIFSIDFTDGIPIPITIRGLTIKNGKANSDGGAVFINYLTTVHLIDVAITGNTAPGSGGAIFSAGTFVLTRSLISSNTANGLYGGGIVNINHSGLSIISNSTLTNNNGNKGGAIYNNGNLMLINDTISHNTATVGGSGVMNDSIGTASVLNTIIGMDISSPTSSLSGAFNSLGNNLVTDARNSSGFTNGVNGDQVSDNNAVNPLLGNLADNGGQTDTRAILEGSPALDRGNSCIYRGNCASPVPQGFRLFSDQRVKYLRQGGSAVDVGAYEVPTLFVSSSAGIGGFGLNNRAGGALLILTEGSTNKKQTRVTNPFGNFFFDNLEVGEVYFLERKPKRAQQRSGLTILATDLLASPPPPPPPSASILKKGEEEFKLTVTVKNDK